jgi:hypothetical protein
VTPEYVRELKEAGFEEVAPEKLIEMRSLGLTGERLKRLRSQQ